MMMLSGYMVAVPRPLRASLSVGGSGSHQQRSKNSAPASPSLRCWGAVLLTVVGRVMFLPSLRASTLFTKFNANLSTSWEAKLAARERARQVKEREKELKDEKRAELEVRNIERDVDG